MADGYLHDPDAIYRRSFALIREAADLSHLPRDLRAVALRLIHTCGDPSITDDLVASPGAATRGRKALAAGAEILADATMVAAGITSQRARCLLNDRRVPVLAKRLKTTRSAAATELWKPHLDGAVVAIGNAPTALFHLLELIAAGAPRPALILGFPVGFVGAAEAKAALAANPWHIPFIALRGRRGGSAMAAAAVNALLKGRPMAAWLAVIGIGEDGWDGLSEAAKALIAGAALIVGGERHLALVPAAAGERLAWKRPLAETLPLIAAQRGRRVAVLASGDPLCYGVGALLARNFASEEMIMLPRPSAFSLAAARLHWPIEECVTLSLHGRPPDRLRLQLTPGARILALTEDGASPAKIARLLTASGWGASQITALEHLGGAQERRVSAQAAAWTEERCADLNLIALECRASPDAKPLSRRAGLPDEAFRHDGQITKRVVRAATLAALAPLPGELLWDIGAGSGSIAIEWLRADEHMKATAIERDAARAAMIAENAAILGVPEIKILHGSAPQAFAGLAAPDAIFIGGGTGHAAIWDAAWPALKPGGRLVANAVTVKAEAELMRRHTLLGGELQRIAVSRAEGEGFWRPAMTVTQLTLRKPQ